jgi:hypothetical protein
VSRFSLIRPAYSAAFRSGWVWLIQFLGNIALFIIFVLWLWISDAHSWQLAGAALLAVALLCGTLVLHGGTLNYFLDRAVGPRACLGTTFGRAFRNLLPFALWLLVAYALWHQVGRLDAFSEQVPTFLRSEFPAWLRRHVTLNALENAYAVGGFILQWIVAIGLLLPPALQTANLGFRGFGRKGLAAWGRTIARFDYWVVVAIAAVVGVWASSWDLSWRPTGANATENMETFSLVIRVLFAYLLVLGSWLTTCSMLGACAAGAADSSGKSADKPA